MPYGPVFRAGDTIGVGVDLARRGVYFTRNGVHLGLAVSGMDLDVLPYAACVGFASVGGGTGATAPSEETAVAVAVVARFNFGSRPFKYRGLALPAPEFRLRTQSFLCPRPACAGMFLGRPASPSPYLELSPDDDAGEGEGAPAGVGAEQEPPLLVASFTLPACPSQAGEASSPASPISPHPRLPGPDSLSLGAADRVPRTPLVAVVHSAQTLLAEVEYRAELVGLSSLRKHFPSAGVGGLGLGRGLALAAYVKQGEAGNFKLVARSSNTSAGRGQGQDEQEGLVLSIPTVHQSQPGRHLMLVLQGTGTTGPAGPAEVLAVCDEVLALNDLARLGAGAAVECALTREGRVIPGATLRVSVRRVTGGRSGAFRAHLEGSAPDFYSPTRTPAGSAPSTPGTPAQHHSRQGSLQFSPHHGSASRPEGQGQGQGQSLRVPHHAHSASVGGPSPTHAHALRSPVAASSPPPLVHSRSASSASYSTLARSGGGLEADADELELAPLTRKLNRIYREYVRMHARLQRLREEVAAYLDEEEWRPLFTPAAATATGSTATEAGSAMAAAGTGATPNRSPSALHSSPSSGAARRSVVGVGAAAEQELDGLVAAGGGAYSALFHCHVLQQTHHQFANLRALIPAVHKQHQRMLMPFHERMRKREERVDRACLFQ